MEYDILKPDGYPIFRKLEVRSEEERTSDLVWTLFAAFLLAATVLYVLTIIH